MSTVSRPPASVHTAGMNALCGDHMKVLCEDVVQHVRRLFESAGGKDPAHNVRHIEAVAQHVRQALKVEKLTERQEVVAVLAALLHEADDAKLFPSNPENCCNARAVLAECLPPTLAEVLLNSKDAADALADEVVEVIELVSCRKNKDGNVPKGMEWKLIVRDADRIEAVGEVGIARCFAYNQKVGAPLFLPTTPRPRSEKEIWKIATPERFAAYSGESDSMIDHYFDKLLHLQRCGSGNRYLEAELQARLQTMLDFVLRFSATGDVDVQELEALQEKHCNSKGLKRKVASGHESKDTVKV